MFSFGAQARDDASVVEKCIIAAVKIIDDRGAVVGGRPNSEKYFRVSKSLICLNINLGSIKLGKTLRTCQNKLLSWKTN